MEKELKDKLFFIRMVLLVGKGLLEKKIVPFDDSFYNKLNNTYIDGLPVSFHIKYLYPKVGPGKCYDRSLYMFFSIDESILVRGDNKDLEIRYGKENAGHGWIEDDKYVYDPSSLMKIEKNLYYKLYKPTNVRKTTKEEYCKYEENKKLYESIKNTTISSYKPKGSKRLELVSIIPLVRCIVFNSNDESMKKDFDNWIRTIEYSESSLHDELEEKIKSLKKI